MTFKLMDFSSALIQKQAVNEIVKLNDFTEDYRLVLTRQQAVELVETRAYALNASGRIEFGGGVIDKIIKAFCDSPFISMYNYTETLHELILMFYYYKNDALDLITDDDLIKFMKKAFDGVCQGSLELLSGRELVTMAHNLRYGHAPDYIEEECCEDDGEDEYE